jgi:branched-chain amino acid transport system permease protein
MGGEMHGLIYGVILLIVVLTMPRGLVSKFGDSSKNLLDRLPGTAADDAVPAVPQRDASRFSAGQVILKAEHLKKNFGGLKATDDVSLVWGTDAKWSHPL